VIAVLLALTSAWASQPETHARAAARRRPPNIVIFITDDQRADGTLEAMPETVRWFARRGTSFVNAYATTPVCCPSRASFFTGRYAHNHGVRTNAPGQVENLDQATTIQSYLQRAGYSTGIVGKYLNGWPLSEPPPSFDLFAHCKCRYYFSTFNVNGVNHEVYGYNTDFIADQSIEFLESMEATDKKPWFLLVSTKAPHRPSTPASRYAQAPVSKFELNPAHLEEDRDDKPAYVQDDELNVQEADRFRRKQLRSLMSVDDVVDEVFTAMGEMRERRKTLAFFASDNGVMWEEHGISGKGVPYTPAIRIPLLMRWPRHVARGVEDTRLVANIDVARTVLDAANVAPDFRMDGISLLRRGTRDRLLIEMFGSNNRPDLKWASTVSTDYQYIEYFAGDSPDPTFHEYYDLIGDPWQLTNLFGDGDASNDPSISDLSTQLQADMKCEGKHCP
jgi:arylsulfatase A-like enzyme